MPSQWFLSDPAAVPAEAPGIGVTATGLSACTRQQVMPSCEGIQEGAHPGSSALSASDPAAPPWLQLHALHGVLWVGVAGTWLHGACRLCSVLVFVTGPVWSWPGNCSTVHRLLGDKLVPSVGCLVTSRVILLILSSIRRCSWPCHHLRMVGPHPENSRLGDKCRNCPKTEVQD